MRTPAFIRMGHPLAFVSLLNKIGAPVRRRLLRSGLPAFELDPDAFVPLSRAWLLFEQASELDVPLAGWWAGQHAAEQNLNHLLLDRLKKAPTLYRSLQRLVQNKSGESSHLRLWIYERKDDILLCTHHPGWRDVPGYMQSQLYQLQVLISVIRQFTGSDWVPKEIGLEHAPRSGILDEHLLDCRIRVERPAGYVAVSRTHIHKAAQRTKPESEDSGAPVLTGDWDYADVLRALLKPYLHEGYPTVRFAAGLMDTSPRTLARRLSALGLGYRTLVDEVRFTVAKERLCEPHVRLSDVAWSVGFRDQSHFTRMFRRVGGVTPGQMRRAALPNGA